MSISFLFLKIFENVMKKGDNRNIVYIIVFNLMKNKGWITIAVGVLLMIIIIMLIVLITRKKHHNLLIENLPEEVDGLTTMSMEPFTEGDFTYRFEGIDWMIESQDEVGARMPLTHLAWTLDTFSRRDGGVPVTLRRPFDLGTVAAQNCIEIEHLSYDTTMETGIPLSFLQCAGETEEGLPFPIDYVVFQEGKNVVVKTRARITPTSEVGFETIMSRDLTQLVE